MHGSFPYLASHTVQEENAMPAAWKDKINYLDVITVFWSLQAVTVSLYCILSWTKVSPFMLFFYQIMKDLLVKKKN
jgi:hypothetical protein